jgi:20S proteasome alpha/beta subunit
MTVCIAAICDGGKAIAVASDRMVSGPDIEFEQDVRKIEKLSKTTLAMTAGSALEHIDLLRSCCLQITQRTSPRVFDIAELTKEEFVGLRKKRSEEVYFKPLGLTIEDFLRRQGQFNENTVLRLTRSLEAEELELVIIIAGVDSTGAHIYLISDPGIAQCFDALGFCCIGSGEHHATMTFVRTGYHVGMSLNSVAYLVYEAKRDSEVVPGVGETYTDVAIINNNGINFLNPDLLEQFKTEYNTSRKARRDFFKQLSEKIEKIKVIEEDENVNQ